MSQSPSQKPSPVVKAATSAPRVSRRAFLRFVAGSSLIATLAGCTRRVPGSTPTPTRTPRLPSPLPAPSSSSSVAPATPASISAVPPGTPGPNRLVLPYVSGGGAPDQALAAAGTPTLTGTPTATRPPTATPTPTATRFPSGPATKLGLFISRNDPRIRELLVTGNVALVKTMEYDANFAQEIKSLSPRTLLVGRIDLPQVELSRMTDPVAEAQAFANRLLPIATEPKRLAAFDAWESYNEPVADTPEHMSRFAQFEAERVRLLGAAGVRSVIGNFATGHPPMELWPHFRPAIEAAIKHKGYLGLHEYAAPTMQFGTPQDPLGWGVNGQQEGWLTLRYRKVYRQFLQPNGLALPIVLTEIGVDGMVGNRPGPSGKGWMDFARYWEELGLGSDAPGNYVEQLAWYDAHLQQDKYILGGAIFAAGASPGWESYEIMDQVEPFLRQYISVHPAPV